MKIILMYPTVGGGSLVTAQNVEEALREEEGVSLKVIDPWMYRVLIKERSLGKDEDEINRLTKVVSNEYLVKVIKEFRPDLFLTVFGLYIKPEIFRLLKKEGVRSCCWFLDDPWGFKEASSIASSFDFFFTHEPTTVERYKLMGVNARYLPEACNPNVHKKVELTEEERDRYRCDLSFVGRPYPNRIEFLQGLTDYDLGIWGDGWNGVDISPGLKRCIRGGEVGQEEMVKIFNASKIALNLHPTYGLKGEAAGEGISPRTFAIAGCGVFQLVDYRRELERLFRVGEEIILFNSIDEVRGLIDYYLSHPEERKAIGLKAQEKVYREHTYKHRIEEMLGFIGECNRRV